MRKTMRRSLLLSLLALVFGIPVSCAGEPVDSTAAVGSAPVTDPAEQTTAGTEGVSYQITFVANGRPTVVTVPAGEIPVFPGSPDKSPDVHSYYRFLGWDREIVPASEDTMYRAQYERIVRTYPVQFRVDGTVVATVETAYGEVPVFPDTPPTDGEAVLAFWLGAVPVTGPLTCDAVFTTMDPEMLAWSYDTALFQQKELFDHAGDVNNQSSAFLYLALAQHDYPVDGPVQERVLAHVRNLISGGKEPMFNAGPFWHYETISMALAVVRHTPSLWDHLTGEEQDRVDLVMECFAISTAFATDDDNFYKTGPALTGNFYKTWNPNHRMAMILPIVAATVYFSADGQDGAARVNRVLTGFDHAAYIERFDQYGFTRVKACWTTPGGQLPDGTCAPGAAELMMNGGAAYLCAEDSGSVSNGLKAGDPAGTGVGVRTTYTYCGVGLDDLAGIVELLYRNNYSGGTVVSDTSGYRNGTDADGNPLAYILDGTRSPVEGEQGMMLEFISNDAAGIRSSNSYCTHDFILVVQSLAALQSLDAYDFDPQSDLFRLVWVGNTDLIYKNEHGYHAYSIGKGHDVTESGMSYYLPWKSWWQSRYSSAFPLS